MIESGGSFNPETMCLWAAAMRLAAWDVIIDVEGSEPEVLGGAGRAVSETAEFCCLIEISHLEPGYLKALEQQFLVYALHRERGQIERIDSLEKVRNEASGYWHQDVILRRLNKGAGSPGASLS
jgi:hypothetical protein